jgi:hypothetical protein
MAAPSLLAQLDDLPPQDEQIVPSSDDADVEPPRSVSG